MTLDEREMPQISRRISLRNEEGDHPALLHSTAVWPPSSSGSLYKMSGIERFFLLSHPFVLNVFIVCHKLINEPVRGDLDNPIGNGMGELMIV
jgi:hypothetical protein